MLLVKTFSYQMRRVPKITEVPAIKCLDFKISKQTVTYIQFTETRNRLIYFNYL